jgi:prevent-host-death family protein
MELTNLPLASLRSDLSDVVTRVQYERERVVIARHGKAVAAIISMKDLERLLQLERTNAERGEESQEKELTM